MSTRLILFIICMLISVQSIYAQNFQPLEATQFPDFVQDIVELDNGHFMYLHTYYFPDRYVDVLDSVDYNYTTVKVVDENFELVDSYDIQSNSDEEILMGYNILLQDDGYLIYGISISLNSFFRKMFLVKLNLNLEEVSRHIFSHRDDLFFAQTPMINLEGNLVLNGIYGGFPATEGFVGEFTLEGELLNIVEFFTQTPNNFVQLPDSSYLMQGAASTIVSISTDWTLGEFIPHIDLKFTPNDAPKLLADGRWIFSGRGRTLDPVTMEEYSTSKLAIFYPDNTAEVVYEVAHPDRPGMFHGGLAMDMIDTSCIYFSNSYVGCISLFYPPDSCLNFLSIHNVQLNGQENWTQYVGFDAAYYPLKVLATQDGGVILLAHRFNEADNPDGREGDMYFIKFDKEGNYNLPVNTENTQGIVIQKILLYPNPASDYIRYQYNLPSVQGLQIQIYDAAGRLVLEDSIVDKETQIDMLSAGSYFYQIQQEGEVLQNGKLQVY